MMKEGISCTPKIVIENKTEGVDYSNFSIPLYQRLFSWKDEEIIQLLGDLHDSFVRDQTEPYYIGILTAYSNTKDKCIDLVDGQQRFTVLTLIALVLSKKNIENNPWKNFIKINNTFRLKFFAREHDNEYLEALYNAKNIEEMISIDKDININMKRGIICINNTLNKFTDLDLNKFSSYIYDKLTFFISYLPDGYSTVELNKYFEAMNSRGKGLENYDILKVKLLNILTTQPFDKQSDILTDTVALEKWNKAYDDFTQIEDKVTNSDDNKKGTSIIELIKSIPKNEIQKPKHEERSDSNALFSFPIFLLLVRYKQLEKLNKLPEKGFSFNPTKIMDAFSSLLDKAKSNITIDDQKEVSEYFTLLEKYNDYLNGSHNYFIKKDENGESTIIGAFKTYDEESEIEETENKTNDEEVNNLHKLAQFQAMLYVSSSSATYYKWFIPALSYIDDNKDFTCLDFLTKLKSIDNLIHKNEWQSIKENQTTDFKYPNIERYWFWRLDYELWENRAEYFSNKDILIDSYKNKVDSVKKLAENYKFKQNRSIEHISPQTPEKSDDINVDVEHLHSFGNLSMISASQNSSLQNSSFDFKRVHVKEYIENKGKDTIESLKMLYIYTHFDKWTNQEIDEHGKAMFNILDNIFGDKK